MSRRIMLSVFVVALAASAVPAGAADLSTQSRLGAIFAEPVVVASRGRACSRSTTRRRSFPTICLPNPPWNRGNYNYGSSWSFYYPGPYYGGPYDTDGARLPYVCGFYGYC